MCSLEFVKSNIRGESTGETLRELLNKNGEKPIPILFDIIDTETIPVGDLASEFTNHAGLVVGDYVPKY